MVVMGDNWFMLIGVVVGSWSVGRGGVVRLVMTSGG